MRAPCRGRDICVVVSRLTTTKYSLSLNAQIIWYTCGNGCDPGHGLGGWVPCLGSFFCGGSGSLAPVAPLFRGSHKHSCSLIFAILIRIGIVSYALRNFSSNICFSVRYGVTGDAGYDRGITFCLKWFLNDGGSLINPKLSRLRHLFCVIFVEYPGHALLYPVAFFFF